MSRFDNEVRVQPSVLDRLLDYEPELTREPAASRSKSLRLLKASVRRDLEWLLNTRQAAVIPPELKEVNESLAVFGMPDFTNFSGKNPHDQGRLRRSIERVIEVFEPRLEGVVVTMEGGGNSPERAVRFRIDGRLKIDPAPEPVTFDTHLQIGSGEFRVKGE